ncbi:MAG: CDP-diacylglycerol---glycerol-3-phosphate 3-phosphatidyltransferase [Actinomycetota bacterium]|nr:CDP-diacylglycerol---glycerol-3-phosphate 3-phosphatidyltransferase [Actinomycetota bacterium]
MINAKVRAGWDRLMRPVGRALGKSGLSPNMLTLFGVLLHAVIAVWIAQGRFLLAGLVAIVAAFSDAFDGAVAKARGMTSSFGALLDSTTDRISDALIFLPIAWVYGVQPDLASHNHPWVAGLAMGTLVVSFVVSYVKARAEGLGFDCNVGFAERAERLILIIAALILDVVPVMLVILCAASIVTFFQRLFYVRSQALDQASKHVG